MQGYYHNFESIFLASLSVTVNLYLNPQRLMKAPHYPKMLSQPQPSHKAYICEWNAFPTLAFSQGVYVCMTCFPNPSLLIRRIYVYGMHSQPQPSYKAYICVSHIFAILPFLQGVYMCMSCIPNPSLLTRRTYVYDMHSHPYWYRNSVRRLPQSVTYVK